MFSPRWLAGKFSPAKNIQKRRSENRFTVWAGVVFTRENSWKVFFYKWRFMWRLRWSERENARSQRVHLNGLCPVCFRMWRVNSSERANFQPQPSQVHLYGFSPKILSYFLHIEPVILPVWVRKCALRWLDFVYVLAQPGYSHLWIVVFLFPGAFRVLLGTLMPGGHPRPCPLRNSCGSKFGSKSGYPSLFGQPHSGLANG